MEFSQSTAQMLALNRMFSGRNFSLRTLAIEKRTDAIPPPLLVYKCASGIPTLKLTLWYSQRRLEEHGSGVAALLDVPNYRARPYRITRALQSKRANGYSEVRSRVALMSLTILRISFRSFVISSLFVGTERFAFGIVASRVNL